MTGEWHGDTSLFQTTQLASLNENITPTVENRLTIWPVATPNGLSIGNLLVGVPSWTTNSQLFSFRGLNYNTLPHDFIATSGKYEYSYTFGISNSIAGITPYPINLFLYGAATSAEMYQVYYNDVVALAAVNPVNGINDSEYPGFTGSDIEIFHCVQVPSDFEGEAIISGTKVLNLVGGRRYGWFMRSAANNVDVFPIINNLNITVKLLE
jgi:hypothetical protein